MKLKSIAAAVTLLAAGAAAHGASASVLLFVASFAVLYGLNALASRRKGAKQ